MDSERVATSVIASALTAAVLYAGALGFDFFTVSLGPTDIPQIAREFINDDDSREALLSFMLRDEEQRFRGPQGKPSEQGDPRVQGRPGEVPGKSVKFFSLSLPKDDPASETTGLGEHEVCSLSRVHLPHASQACGCVLQQNNAIWSLALATDTKASGA